MATLAKTASSSTAVNLAILHWFDSVCDSKLITQCSSYLPRLKQLLDAKLAALHWMDVSQCTVTSVSVDASINYAYYTWSSGNQNLRVSYVDGKFWIMLIVRPMRCLGYLLVSLATAWQHSR
jgi:hypothetical protein